MNTYMGPLLSSEGREGTYISAHVATLLHVRLLLSVAKELSLHACVKPISAWSHGGQPHCRLFTDNI